MYKEYILSPVSDDFSGRERMAVETISWSISTKVIWLDLNTGHRSTAMLLPGHANMHACMYMCVHAKVCVPQRALCRRADGQRMEGCMCVRKYVCACVSVCDPVYVRVTCVRGWIDQIDRWTDGWIDRLIAEWMHRLTHACMTYMYTRVHSCIWVSIRTGQDRTGQGGAGRGRAGQGKAVSQSVI